MNIPRIDVWQIDLSKEEAEPLLLLENMKTISLKNNMLKDEVLFSLLSEEEKKRANRFITVTLQKQFIRAHGQMRVLLAQYLKKSPADLLFSENAFQKPELRDSAGKHCIYFNLSHSHEYALLAISHDTFVGIDLEWHQRKNHSLDIAKRFFSPPEIKFIESASLPERAFFKIWCRKEAFIKAYGQGLHFSLESFDVTAENNQVRFLSNLPNDAAKYRWILQDLDLFNCGYSACLGYRAID